MKRMLRLLSTPAGFLSLLVLLSVASYGIRALTGQPEISLESAQLEFGPFPNSGVHEIVLPISNSGDRPLGITNIKTGCACLKTSFTSLSLVPAETAELKLAYASDHKPLGRSNERIFIYSNDPKHPVLDVRLAILVEPIHGDINNCA